MILHFYTFQNAMPWFWQSERKSACMMCMCQDFTFSLDQEMDAFGSI